MSTLAIIGCVIGGVVIGGWIAWRIFKNVVNAAIGSALNL